MSNAFINKVIRLLEGRNVSTSNTVKKTRTNRIIKKKTQTHKQPIRRHEWEIASFAKHFFLSMKNNNIYSCKMLKLVKSRGLCNNIIGMATNQQHQRKEIYYICRHTQMFMYRYLSGDDIIRAHVYYLQLLSNRFRCVGILFHKIWILCDWHITFDSNLHCSGWRVWAF